MSFTQIVKLYSIPEFAESLGVTVACIRRWLLEGKISYCKVGRLVKIPATERVRILSEGYRPAKAANPRRAQ